MKKITVNLYEYNELSETAKHKAHDDYLNTGFDSASSYDFRATLYKFCAAFNVNLIEWQVDEFNYSFRFSVNEPDEMDAQRFATWVYNNFGHLLTEGKSYYKGSKRHVSRVMADAFYWQYALTGCCYDSDILEPVHKCIDRDEDFKSMKELVEDCFDSFFATWKKQIEYENSEEYFEEVCNCNEWYFTESGEFYNG